MVDLNLDAIEARSAASVEAEGTRDWHAAIGATADDVPALVARVRELEATVQRVRDETAANVLWNQANHVGHAIDTGMLDGTNGAAVAAAIRATTPEEFAAACALDGEGDA